MDNRFDFLEEVPEKAGVSSDDIAAFIDDLEKNGMFMHSILLIRKGKVLAEGYYSPFKKDELHRAYSISKTFTATAIALLCEEGRLSLSDKVYKFFPDKCPDDLHPYIKDVTVRDLLMMSTPFEGSTYRTTDKDWAWTFFNTKPSHPAGTVFRYDTSGTYILSTIVERMTKKTYLEYLKDKFLRDMGFSENAWCIKAPEGNSWGGSGVMCTTRDLARLGMLYLNNGRVGDKQILSEGYVKAATSKQIDNNPEGHEMNYRFGYGYKIWITPDGSFSFMGMGNQEVICIPDKDFMFVCTADNQGNLVSEALIYELLWKHIVSKLSDKPLTENENAYKNLKEKLSDLSLHKIRGAAHSKAEKEIDSVRYELNENNMQISKIHFEFLEDCGKLCYTTPRGDKEILFGYGEYKIGTFPETHYYGDTIGTPSGREYRCAAIGVWTEENKLVIKVNIIDDYLGNLSITCGFKEDEVGIYMYKAAEWFLNEYFGFAGGKKIKSIL